jgi:hypothetical protein
MLIIGGHNPAGNILHVIVGPETELFTDIHGAKVLDITQILSNMKGDERVFLSLTRCKSEAFTAASLQATNVQYMNSFTGQQVCDQPSHHVVAGQSQGEPPVAPKPSAQNKQANPQVPQQPVLGLTVMMERGRCQYCGTSDKALMPLQGIRICSDCMAIELGRMREQDKKELDSFQDTDEVQRPAQD